MKFKISQLVSHENDYKLGQTQLMTDTRVVSISWKITIVIFCTSIKTYILTPICNQTKLNNKAKTKNIKVNNAKKERDK